MTTRLTNTIGLFVNRPVIPLPQGRDRSHKAWVEDQDLWKEGGGGYKQLVSEGNTNSLSHCAVGQTVRVLIPTQKFCTSCHPVMEKQERYLTRGQESDALVYGRVASGTSISPGSLQGLCWTLNTHLHLGSWSGVFIASSAMGLLPGCRTAAFVLWTSLEHCEPSTT